MRRTGSGWRRRTAIALGIWALAASPLLAGKEETPPLDVPYVPTHQKAVEEMLKMAKVTSEDYVIDLGCGDGRIVVTAAKKHKARGLGVDLDPQRVRESKQNVTKAGVGDLVEIRKGDALKTDVRKATVVTLFLLESVNVRLRPRLFAQLKPGTRVVSNSFHMRDWKADKQIRHTKAYSNVILFWVIPAPVGGSWTWQTKLGGNQIAGSLKLEQEFQVVWGVVRHGAAAAARISEPSLAGKELRFTARLGTGKERAVVTYTGTADGDVIRGTQEWRGGSHAGKHPWIATRKPVDITGRWLVRAPSRPGANGTLRIWSEADGLKAAYLRDDQPKKELPLPGFYVWGSSVRFEVPLGGSPLAFRGSLGPDVGGGSVSPEESKKRTAWSAKRLPSP